MKKLIAILLCIAICLSFVGCQKPEKQEEKPTEQQTEKPTENATEKSREALEKVLNKEASFTYKWTFGTVTEQSLEKFTFNTESVALETFSPVAYSYVDFDSDGVEELLVAEMGLHFYLILRYDNGKVNGYILERLSAQEIKTDGSFVVSWHKGPESVNRVQFDGLECKLTELACKDETENIYTLKEKTATKETVESYFAGWKSSGEKITWIKIKQK
jgi:hypothetical protein